MKPYLKVLLALLFIPLLFTACSKDDDPADNDIFVGTYKGKISYKNGDKDITVNDGSVRVVKVGKNYSFAFSDGISDINNVEFSKDANTAISVGTDKSKLITISAKSLTIAYTKEGAIWTANCSR